MSEVDPGASPPPPPPPPPIPARALLHESESTRTYPCASCGAQLVFDIGSQKLRCPSCGTAQDIVTDPSRQTVEQDLRAAVRALEDDAEAAGPQIVGEKEVVCQSCGGHTTFTGTLTSTRCPYCATPIQRDDVHDAPARLPVDGILPFQVDESRAREALERWINGRRFAPNEFKKYKTTGSFTSVYASYFTYDAETATEYEGRRGDNYTVVVGSGDNRRTETRVRWRRVDGRVSNDFDDVTVLANTGFDPERVTALEPWPTGRAVPFSPEYVAGHLSRTYDRDVETCFGDAKTRMEPVIEDTIRDDIGGDHQDIRAKRTQYGTLTYKHLLLPIWLLTVIYQQKPFQVFINGVTGEVQGERPWSKVKIALAVVAALIVAVVVLAIWSSSRSS